mmetsp:Transcript_5960/g.10387  ORF Transcript_5960/g.10387 Transcript_5960/m.10387 type:complete len:201 (+) Transcript_5960:73-675(+)|eukprot:CAMPEP_0119116500 /NCGR_PEP_ID=MMETSP1180-20130426/52316_1 /TAXON_ID=3052 ORGANISM="Chlamydomonas cf sp, Strain CCMP681" /NCGR_SAMPLE_ID=MMETSP1180 /ASSEMBLY_ACC=CAM_ASM_000741 /LENGTH=200 /DNA_ID=CAMNT_0007105653 /DNA_START=73 /DNA_END=675 /DNA_ORIENTATION=+
MVGHVSLQQSLGLPQPVDDLLMWRQPATSAAVLGGLTGLYLLLSTLTFAFLLKAEAGLVVLALLASVGSRLIGRPAMPLPHILKEGVSSEQWTKLSNKALAPLNLALSVLNLLASGTNPVLSIWVAGGLFISSLLATKFTIVSIAYTAVVCSFLLPKLYELRKEDADKMLATFQNKSNDIWAKVNDVVLKKIPKVEKKTQ